MKGAEQHTCTDDDSREKKVKKKVVLPMNSIPSSSAAPDKEGGRDREGKKERERIQQLKHDVLFYVLVRI